MTDPTHQSIPALLMQHVTRDLIMGVEEALVVGAQRAYTAARGMDDGHLPHVVGQLRHFHMNEAFQRALAAADASPTPIKGNGIVIGRTGAFRLARFNIAEGAWVNGRRSQTRRQMSMANMAVEPLVQPGLFSSYTPPSEAVAFFVSCFSGLRDHPESPVSIQIAVPDRHMRGWLFRERLDVFMNRYDQKPAVQHDFAVPKLKKRIDKQQGNDGSQQ